MPTVSHILFPYDFSPEAGQVVRYVRALAQRTGAAVTLYSVVPPTFEAMPAGMDAGLRAGEDAEGWRRALQTRLDKALIGELAGLRVERVADGGDPAIRTTDFARTHAVDLIMMPTHGLGLFRTMLLGSVTAKVLHDAACPVWTAAHAETQTAPELPATILCAVDGTPAAAALMTWAAEFARNVGASLTLLHVVGPISDWTSLESERRLQDQVRDEAQARVASVIATTGIDAPLRVAVGPIAASVAEEARREGADLVIVGRGSVVEAFGRLRTHAFGIIQRSPCPVISV